MTPGTGTRQVAQGRHLLVGSTVAYVLAASVATTLHEVAHAVAGLALGQAVTLSSFSADPLMSMSDGDAAVMAAAGPVFSLLSGVLVILTYRRVGRGSGRLFLMWLGFISVQNFVGYLAITPFGAGDSGAFVELLGLPRSVGLVFCLVGAAGVLALGWVFLRHECRYVSTASALRRIGLFAWLLGTAVTLARTAVEAVINGADGSTVAIVVAGAATAGVFVPVFSRAWQRVAVDREQLDLRMPTTGIALAVLVIAVQVAVLAPGVRLG